MHKIQVQERVYGIDLNYVSDYDKEIGFSFGQWYFNLIIWFGSRRECIECFTESKLEEEYQRLEKAKKGERI